MTTKDGAPSVMTSRLTTRYVHDGVLSCTEENGFFVEISDFGFGSGDQTPMGMKSVPILAKCLCFSHTRVCS